MSYVSIFLILTALKVSPGLCVKPLNNVHDGVPFKSQEDPAHPGLYPLNVMQTISLQNRSKGGDTMGVYFKKFNLEDSPGCDNDYVVIINRAREHEMLWGPVCGFHDPSRTTPSIFNVMLLFQAKQNLDLVFSSDPERSSTGFSGILATVNSSSSNDLLPCSHFVDVRQGWIRVKPTSVGGRVTLCKFYLTSPLDGVIHITVPVPRDNDTCGIFRFYDIEEGREKMLGELHVKNTSKTFSIHGTAEQMVITFEGCRGFEGELTARYTAVPRENIENHQCPDDYNLFEGFCYSYKRQYMTLTWERAETECIKEGSHLVSVQSRKEMRFLNRLLNNFGLMNPARSCDPVLGVHRSGVFIGMNNRRGQTQLGWSDQSSFVYSEWYGPVKYGFNDYQIPAALDTVVKKDILQPIPDRTYACSLMMPFFQGFQHGRSRWANWARCPCQRPICCMSAICKKPATRTNTTITLTKMSTNQSEARFPGRKTRAASFSDGGVEDQDLGRRQVFCPRDWVFVKGRCFHLHRLANIALKDMSASNMTVYITYSQSDSWIFGGTGVEDLTFNSALEKCASIGGEVATFERNSFPLSEFFGHYFKTWAKEIYWVNQSAMLVSDEQNGLNSKPFAYFSSSIWFRSPEGECLRVTLPDNGLPHISWIQRYDNCIHETTQVSLFALCEAAILTETRECSGQQFQCNDGSCISIRNVCDGDNNCPGRKDEMDCACGGLDTFQCADKSCIPISKVCDYVKDCEDESDEDWCIYPTYTDKQYRCSKGKYADNPGSCDANPNTAASPNTNMSNSPPPQNEPGCPGGFRCYAGPCVKRDMIDDRYPDCPGVTQEDEPLGTIPTTEDSNCGPVTSTRSFNYTYCPRLDQIRCSPGHVKCFPRYQACIFDRDKIECRHFEYIQQCERFECPGMFKCPNAYCIPLRQVCNGEKDCPHGEDEDRAVCRNYTCPGHFRCRGETQCLHQSEVCDGEVNCRHSNDDEVFCTMNVTLPAGCSHSGYFLNCTGQSLSSIPRYSYLIRGLEFAKNNLHLSQETFHEYRLLVKVNISFNNLTSIYSSMFSRLSNVLELDLSHNRIDTLFAKAFVGLRNLKLLHLHGNPMQHIQADSFEGVVKLPMLDLSFLNIKRLRENAFRGLDALLHLNLSHNALPSIGNGAFRGLPKLKSLDISSNKEVLVAHKAFTELKTELLDSDRFDICCLAVSSGEVDVCLPPRDEFSSCSDLLQNPFLQVSIWVMGMAALLGNATVILCWLRTRDASASSIFVLNLAMADLLMGVYLLILAAVDFMYRGEFFVHSVQWMSSALCKLSGVLSMVSSEMSVFVLMLITTDRLLSIVYAMKVQKMETKTSVIIVCLGWVLFFILATAPLIETGYFKDFYGHNSVCLPFTLSTVDLGGEEYAYVIFVFFNFVAFIYMLSAYCAILRYVYESRKRSGREETDRDIHLLKKVSLILITDFLCWVPVTVLGILRMWGVSVGLEVSSWVAVFILPINSAMNPILYTLANIKLCRKKKKKTTGSHPQGNSGINSGQRGKADTTTHTLT